MASEQLATVVDMLAARAEDVPDGTAFTFAGRRWSYREVSTAAKRAAGRFQQAGVGRGDNVLLAVPNGAAFFAAFYGTQWAGATAVPVYPGLGPPQVLAAARSCRARLIVGLGDEYDSRSGELRRLAARHGIAVLSPVDWRDTNPHASGVDLGPEDIAFIQYTSGSTGEPRGVQITHHNLLTNIGQLIAGMEITTADRFVSWLPTYHDMGLILMTMVPFYLGAELHLLPTSLRDVGTWLEAIQRTRGTFTAAPDFAYRLCLRKVADRVDLSSLRVALNAAEPVRARTIADFERTFGLDGVMVAGYGLAEATVGVSAWPPGSKPRVDGRGFVSVGKPFPGVAIRIQGDGEEGAPEASGEVLVASTANAAGYYEAPEATAEVFGDDGYVRTGDLGYLDGDGNLYIVGRKKNIIIVGGRNLAPQEIVQIVDSRPAVRLSAAVGIDRGGNEGEQAHVFAEVRAGVGSLDELHSLAVEIAADIWAGLGIRPARVHVLRPGSIPLTHNGKVRHALLREQFLSGALAEEGAVLYPRR